jgi:hypothetical protein
MTQAIRKAAQDFCRRSRSWRDWVDGIGIVFNTPVVPIPAPIDSQVIEIKQLAYMGRNLDSANNLNLRAFGYDDPDRVGSAPQLFNTDIDSTGAIAVRIFPIVGVSIPNALRAQVILEPSQDALTLPDYIYRRFARGIGYGAIAMLNETDEPWARAELVPLNRDKFDVEIAAAAGWAESNATSDSRRVRAHFL